MKSLLILSGLFLMTANFAFASDQTSADIQDPLAGLTGEAREQAAKEALDAAGPGCYLSWVTCSFAYQRIGDPAFYCTQLGGFWNCITNAKGCSWWFPIGGNCVF